MIRTLINNWWLLALRGVFAMAFAILAFSLRRLAESFLTRPIVHAGVVVIFGLLALAAGICTIAAAVRRADKDKSHLLLWDGVAVCIAGLVIVLAPKLELTWLVDIVAIWAVVIGVLELLIARRLRRHIPAEWSLAFAGMGSLCLGVYFLLQRSNEGASLLLWLAVYAAFSAVTILVQAYRLRALRSSIHAVASHAELPTSR
jgi:uncharacterized membrane protein HdeD (DUF308 family)